MDLIVPGQLVAPMPLLLSQMAELVAFEDLCFPEEKHYTRLLAPRWNTRCYRRLQTYQDGGLSGSVSR